MGSLSGVTVVDFTRQLPGPFASRELLRLGARVVKVEPPEGDLMPEDLVPRAERREGDRLLGRSHRAAASGAPGGRRRARGLSSRRVGALRDRPAVDDDPLLDHRLRLRRTTRTGSRPRSELPRLRRRPRGHRPVGPAGSDRRSRGRGARCGDRGARGAARPRTLGPRSAHRDLDDPRLAPFRRPPPRGGSRCRAC